MGPCTHVYQQQQVARRQCDGCTSSDSSSSSNKSDDMRESLQHSKRMSLAERRRLQADSDAQKYSVVAQWVANKACGQCRHSRLSGSQDLELWAKSGGDSIAEAYKEHLMGPIIAVKDELFKTFRLACPALPQVAAGGPAVNGLLQCLCVTLCTDRQCSLEFERRCSDCTLYDRHWCTTCCDSRVAGMRMVLYCCLPCHSACRCRCLLQLRQSFCAC